MRSHFVLLIAIFMLILVLAACGHSEDTALITPSPEMTAAPASSPVTSETQTNAPSPSVDSQTEDLIADFISAQNTHDWNAFLSLWTDEEQKYYKDFFAYSDNEKNKNGYFAIKSARLTEIREIENAKSKLSNSAPGDLPDEIASGFRADVPDKCEDFRMFIAKTDYSLDKEFWDYREGLNYRVLVLVPDGGSWKIAQDYQGYPGAAGYFGDAVPENHNENMTETSADENNLVDGTVHYTKELDCYFLGLDWGDYEHLQVRTIEGDERWFWMTQTKVNPETLTRYQKIKITWENRDQYINEAQRVINQDAVIDIKLLD